MNRNVTGFTLIELVTIMVIVGIIAVTALPKFFSKTGFEARGFADEIASMLRYAQKTAVVKRRNVCVTLVASTLTLRLDTVAERTPPNCTDASGAALVSPDGRSPYAATPSTGIGIASTSASFAILPSGLQNAGADVVMTVSASGEPSRTITIANQTGYVYTNY